MRPTVLLALLLTLALAGAGCGGDDAPGSDSPAPSTPERPVPATPRAPADPCTPPLRILPAPATVDAATLAAASDALADVVARAGTTRRPFVTDGDVVVAGGLRARARLVGTRAADGSSTGRLAWRGAASLVLPDGDLRIAANELALRRDDQRDAGFAPLGSASGIALDVGRELLTHPFLLDVVATARRGDVRTWRLVARPADLRAYAGTERQGLATELLLDARSLSIEVRAVDSVLTSDVFRLQTAIPQRFSSLGGGRAVTVVGRTIAGCAPAG